MRTKQAVIADIESKWDEFHQWDLSALKNNPTAISERFRLTKEAAVLEAELAALEEGK